MKVVAIPSKILEELEGRALERAVEAWIALVRAADDLGDGRTFAGSADTICTYGHVTRHVFYRALQDLEQLRLVEITEMRYGPREYDIMRHDLDE